MNLDVVIKNIQSKKSLLCVGLDSELEKLPDVVLNTQYPQYEFNKAIIDATADYAIAYKPNVAFYEAAGLGGWKSLELTVRYIKDKYPDIFLIADAKLGDIGNTSKQYAKAFFDKMDFDAITLSPYMGYDSVAPFLEYENKSVILLAITSNDSAGEIQLFENKEGIKLFEYIISKAINWGTTEQIMFVAGATKPDYIKVIRNITPDSFLLVPGVGAQGGSIKEVMEAGLSSNYGLMINASRSIIFASVCDDFRNSAHLSAEKLQKEIERQLSF